MSEKHTPEMAPVTKAQFYAAMGPRNVHPRAERERSVWIDLGTHAVVGISTPGYASNQWTAPETTYQLSAAIAKATGASHG